MDSMQSSSVAEVQGRTIACGWAEGGSAGAHSARAGDDVEVAAIDPASNARPRTRRRDSGRRDTG